MDLKFGILGFGNMGSAIAEGALLQGVVKAGNVYVYNRSLPAMDKARDLGFNTVGSEDELWKASDVVLLAVKPQFMEEALNNIDETDETKAVISVCRCSSPRDWKDSETSQMRRAQACRYAR